jgi:hypothetical protein
VGVAAAPAGAAAASAGLAVPTVVPGAIKPGTDAAAAWLELAWLMVAGGALLTGADAIKVLGEGLGGGPKVLSSEGGRAGG